MMKNISPPPNPMTANKENFVRSVMLEKQREEIFDTLCKYELDIIPLKGLWFTSLLYNDPAKRPINDLDILVTNKDMKTAGNMLESLGYKADKKTADKIAFGAIVETVYRRENSLPVELHTRVASGISAAAFSAHLFAFSKREEYFHNYHVLIPPFEETIISLVFHFRDHGLKMAPYQTEDVRRLFAKFPIDLDKCIKLAEKYHCMIGLYTMLKTAGSDELALKIEKHLGFNLKVLLLDKIGKIEADGLTPVLPLERFRISERIWRLLLHIFLARDSLKESAISQAEHLYYEIRTIMEIFRQKG